MQTPDSSAKAAPHAEGETEREDYASLSALDGIEPEGWTEAGDDEDADGGENPEDWQDEDWTGHPDLSSDEGAGRCEYCGAPDPFGICSDCYPGAEGPDVPRACGRCCGSSSELDAASGELVSCRDCAGTGLAEPWRDPDYAAARGLCPGCGTGLHLSPEAGSCAACDARLLAALHAEAWGDDPDPGDGGLSYPSWAEQVEAEAAGCPGCGRGVGHLYAGATCAGCLLGRAA